MFGADREAADLTLGCLIDFVYRRLVCGAEDDPLFLAGKAGVVLDGSPAAGEAAASIIERAAQGLTCTVTLPSQYGPLVDQFLAVPQVVFQQPEVLRAALTCCAAGDLQMVLAYVVQQHTTILTTAEELGSEPDTSSEGVAREDEPGCCPLFMLVSGESPSWLRLLEQVHQQQLQSQAAAASSSEASDTAGAEGQRGSGAAPAAAGGGKQGRGVGKRKGGAAREGSPPVAAAEDDSSALRDQAPSPADAAAASTAALAAVAAAAAAPEPYLVPAAWWLEHLQDVSRLDDTPGEPRGELRVLRWVYGGVVSSQVEEFVARQQQYKGSQERSDAILGAYEGLAGAWRRMQGRMDQREGLQGLRNCVKGAFATVKRLEDAGQHCTPEQAAAFLEALFSSLCASSSSEGDGAQLEAGAAASSSGQQQQQLALSQQHQDGGSNTLQHLQLRLNQLAPLYLCEAAVEVVRAQPMLAAESSQQYAHALLERELAVLTLLSAMLEDQGSEARAKQAATAERITAKRSELSCAEAEHARVLADGPASHRKKDMLDKATKEAEHREKLADLAAKIEAAKAAIAADEAAAAGASTAAAEAAADLTRVREQARQIAARKKNLEDLQVQLSSCAPPRPAPGRPAAAAAAAEGGSSSAVSGAALPPAGLGAALHMARSATLLPPALGLAGGAAGEEGAGEASGSAVGPTGLVLLPDPAAASEAAAQAGASDPAAISSAAELRVSWRAQRLECLMYRVLWVAEAVQLFKQQYEPHLGGRQYELLVRASKWARSKCDEYEASVRAAHDELQQIKGKLSELAW
jgi:hypothetical protein